MNSFNYFTKRENKKGFFQGLLEKSAVWWIIVVCVLIYIAELILLSVNTEFFRYFALSAKELFFGNYLWTIFTHIFSHANFVHLFVNMFSLYFIGSLTEKIIGRKRFIWFFLISGSISGIISVLFSGLFGYGIGERIFGSPETYMLGASGAIFGLLGILAVLIPNKKVILILGPLLLIILSSLTNITLLNIILNIILFLMIFTMIFSFGRIPKWIIPLPLPLWLAPLLAIIPLVIISFFVSLPIGNMAHFAGLISGVIYGLYLRNKYKKKVQILQRLIR